MKKIICIFIATLFAHSIDAQNGIIIPNDSLYSKQWAPAKIGLPHVWHDFTTGGTTKDGDQIVVAVVDNGFDYNHEDLNFWFPLVPKSGTDNPNDFSWNFELPGGFFPEPSMIVHGTFVAGIIGAIGNNGKGITGVNWNVKILGLGIGLPVEDTNVIKAYRYAYNLRKLYNETGGQQGAFIVALNHSQEIIYGNPDDYADWCNMFDTLGSVGILSVVGVSNENLNIDQVGGMPARCTSNFLIRVTNSTSSDAKYVTGVEGLNGAGYGVNTLDIAAPGTNIYSTFPGNDYDSGTGTSYAIPQVTGTIALMYAAMPQSMIQAYKNDPATIALQVKQQLLDGADQLPSLNGLVAQGRRLNAYAAVAAAAGVPCNPPNVANISTTRHNTAMFHGSCNNEDFITYFGTTPTTGNSHGIIKGEWNMYLGGVGGMVNITQIDPSPLNMVNGTAAKINIPDFFWANSREAQVKLKNYCGWSQPKIITYLEGFPCSGGGPGDPDPFCPTCFEILTFPNPVVDQLTINFEQLPTEEEQIANYSVKLYDNLGNVHRQTNFNHRRKDGKAKPIKFNTSNLREGTYYLHIEGNEEIHKEQIIIKRK